MNNCIDIDGTYSIEIDKRNWTLKKLVPTQATRKDGSPSANAGKMHKVTLGYFGSLQTALSYYTNNLEKDCISEATGPVSIAELQAILLRIEKLCKGMKLTENSVQDWAYQIFLNVVKGGGVPGTTAMYDIFGFAMSDSIMAYCEKRYEEENKQ